MSPPRRLLSLRRAFGLVSMSTPAVLSGCVDDPSGGTNAPGVTPLEVSFLEGGGMPHLSPSGDGALLSWLAPSGDAHVLRAVRWDPSEGFGTPVEVSRGDDFFVNWADFPSVIEVAPGHWVAHWLQRGGKGTYDYGVRIATSDDAGASWSEAWIPHEDRSPTEHGFVSLWPDGDGGFGAAWLDGHRYAAGPHGDATDEMTVRSIHRGAAGEPSAERPVDDRACDCCQTDVAVTSRGPLLVYRDRSLEDVRDIYASRWVDGAWTDGRPVHDDGWEIGGCPVNGPAVDAAGERVAVAWFTAASDVPRVRLAFSDDGGETFGPAVQVDDGNPVGRTDVVVAQDGTARVIWMEDTGNGGGEIRLRVVDPDGSVGPSRVLTATPSARSSGFPRMVSVADGDLLLAWTESGVDGPEAVRVARLETP